MTLQMRVNITLILAAAALSAAFPARGATCESMAQLSLQNTTVTTAQSVAAGAFTPPAGAQGKQNNAFRALPAFCRVAATIRPVADSEIKIEVWMPSSGWNGKFRGTGNGGLGGSMNFNGIAAAMHGGYAVAGNDTGHDGGASLMMDRPEKILDFGERAGHEMTIKAKAIVEAFYNDRPRHSYMVECGGGSTAAMKAAQRFPTDYDGLVAGGLATYLTHHVFGQIWIWQATHSDPASTIPPEKYPAIHNAVLAACDRLDGVQDGVIEDPTRCKFDPKVLECKTADGPTCLTPPQVAAARKLYAPATNPRTRKEIFGPLFPGSELLWAQSGGPAPVSISSDFFKYFAFKDPSWDPLKRPINFDSDVALADTPENTVINANDPDIRKYAERGGKLILYNGWSDAGIPPRLAVDYYKSAADKLGSRAAKDSLRLFMVPGMGHCGGGDGTDTFDMLSAIEQWVEQGKAPDRIEASRVRDGKTDRTRPVCAYPQVAKYNGSGSTDEAANFTCKAP
jgi:Tannase and feruloyl esterase